MKKIPCLFVREFSGPRDSHITEAVTPGCEWVLASEGISTRKRDGTACAVGVNPERVVKVADRGVVKDALHGFSEREMRDAGT